MVDLLGEIADRADIEHQAADYADLERVWIANGGKFLDFLAGGREAMFRAKAEGPGHPAYRPRSSSWSIGLRLRPSSMTCGEAYFSLSASPIADVSAGSTHLEPVPADQGKSLTVPTRGSIWVRAHLVNKARTEQLLKEEDVSLGVVLRTRDRRIFHGDGYPFRKKVITTSHIELDLDDRK